MLRKRRTFVFGVLFSAGLLRLAAFAHEGHGKSEVGPYDLDTPRQVSPETAAHIGLKTAEVDFGPVEDVLPLSGIVRAAPDRHWAVATRTPGKVLSVRVQVGDRVKEGDLLIEIDSPELARNIYEVRKLEADYQKLLVDIARAEGRVKQLQVEIENSQAAAGLAEAELQRSEDAGANAVPLNVLGERRAAALKARGEAKLKAVDLEIANKEAEALKNQAVALRLSRDALVAIANVEPAQKGSVSRPADDQTINLVRLLAPADGVVIARSARSGHWAAPGETLLEIADYSVVQVEGELPESLIARVVSRSSDKVRIRIAADELFLGEGRVKFISPVLDEVKRTAHVLIEAPNSAGTLRGGMYADLVIVLREAKTAVVVPASAVIQDGPVHFVFTKNGDVYQKQDITPGLSNDQFVEVLAGLAPGDVVVSQGAYSLTQLRPKAASVASAAAPGGAASPK
ncbi:MAG: efflux RND transporter periplasmic adaptor subunit [Planctomycetes bacterium]|nr:efflux RND transporter periplasmic adaptor subunit [Planctomycetota bacterium]MBI3833412.1 efflux RND transporter periplasmic adaptor subunit [Planctomycetota bacterium]